MSVDWLTRIGAWLYGIKGDELVQLEEAMPGLARLGNLAKEADPVLKQGLRWYASAAPIIDEALPLIDELLPLIKTAAPIVEQARGEIEDLLPVYNTVLDILSRHRIAGTDGTRELEYTLQSAYPPNRSDPEVIKSVRATLSAAEVRHLQKRLKVTDDGIFGPKSLQAVKDFQSRNGLTVDGFPGKVTKAVMEALAQ